MKLDIEKFKKWLTDRGAEILPETNEYELLRFKGREVGVIYTSGKVNNDYTKHAISCFKQNRKWSGKPINVGRKNTYRKEKEALIKRDGRDCFYCDTPMEDDITLEHLIALSSGGKNTLANMVLCHEACNIEVNNKPVNEKVKIAINKRLSKL